jgi:hypothetical protein
LGGAKISNLGLAKLKGLVRLRFLGLDGTAVSDKGLAVLGSFERLERLSLWKCKTIDDGAAPYLLASRRLATLDLAETKLTDQGLAQLEKMHQLQRLYLGGTLVTGAGVESFRQKNPQCHVHWGDAAYYDNARRLPSPDDND